MQNVLLVITEQFAFVQALSLATPTLYAMNLDATKILNVLILRRALTENAKILVPIKLVG